MHPSYSSIAGVVVLYNPGGDVWDTIETYRQQISKLYVIDNSVVYNEELTRRCALEVAVAYINNKGNKGIAHALNRGCELARQEGFECILTMDQDTRLVPGFVSVLAEGFVNKLGKIGIVAPRYPTANSRVTSRYQPMEFTMTSGNLVNLNAHKEVGGFMEELFIDHVDHEFCLRLQDFGYQVIQDNELNIRHRPGNVVQVNLWIRRFAFSSHSPIRLYYAFRNGLYVYAKYSRKYLKFRRHFVSFVVNEVVKILFEDQKMKRVRMIVKAVRDFRSGKLGPFVEV
ncbi:glycosyltransferase family 2 protein [Chryseolinea lacunae]|uniref:Glycosyltransferase family 2 protein n=1 Tax=Chryseolinea lacunae TaxID=2801331 RepID=A0ABS1KV73_9BACT|nr:glycosyltransferase family 2 protein [Chryseolinea lacunae]MBL0742221.1 glycosyltransferase family 2 protein [Chryseolinea lacunae]